MSNGTQMIPLDQFGPIADVFKTAPPVDVTKFTAGIGQSWPTLTIKGKTWGVRFRGENKQLTAPNPAAGGAVMAVQFVDVVIVDAAQRISKVYYIGGFHEGDHAPPDCWSADGVTPDPGASKPQSATCRGCKHNVFGSRVGDAGQKGKACPDNKRLAVVSLHDIPSKNYGGPLMLRLPPSSFSNYSTFVGTMVARGYAPHMVAVRLTFDHQVAHPKLEFTPLRPLDNAEATQVLDVLKSPTLNDMLNDKAVAAFADPDAEVEPDTPGTLPPAGAAPPAAGAWGGSTTASPQATPQSAPQKADDLTPPDFLKRTADPVTPVSQPVTPVSQPALTPEQEEIARLKAELAAAKTPEPEPLTPEQLEIQALKAQLAEAKSAKGRKTRPKPVGPPTVTQTGNGAAPPAALNDEPAPAVVGNAIADRVAALAAKKAQ